MYQITYVFPDEKSMIEHMEKFHRAKNHIVESHKEDPVVIDSSGDQPKCAICGTRFTPKSKRSRLCSIKCANIEQRSKREGKNVDELLKKLKHDYPVIETPRPVSYREFL